LLAHNRRDFARLVMARGNHERRFAGPECLEVLLDSSFVQFYAIGELFNGSVVLQLLPACLEPARTPKDKRRAVVAKAGAVNRRDFF
jgi:hypothetical protein